MFKAMNDPSPLVRSAAAECLGRHPSRDAAAALLKATSDDSRLVRVRSAAALAGFPRTLLGGADVQPLRKAAEEHVASLLARPDHWNSHYNLGNFFLNQGRLDLALTAFETSCKLDPLNITPLVNVSIVHAQMGQTGKAGQTLSRALEIDPKNPAAHFNLGLLKAELGDLAAAEKHLRAAVEYDPKLAEAAHNLGVLLSKDRLDEAITWGRRAADLRPREPRYAYTLGHYYDRQGNLAQAIAVLQGVIDRQPGYPDAYLLLGEIYEKQNKRAEAAEIYRKALSRQEMPVQVRWLLDEKLKNLSPK